MGKKLWRDIRAALHVGAVQVLIRVVAAVLAVLGAGEAVTGQLDVPGQVLAEVAKPGW